MGYPIPLHDNILVVEDVPKDQTDSGIHLPQLRRSDKQRTGTVVAVGPGRLFPDYTYGRMDTMVGDRVMFDYYSGTDIHYADQKVTLITDKSILAILDDES